MATSVNGYITNGEDDSDWVSKTDWKEFNTLKKACGIIVMGAKTYEQSEGDFPQTEALNVVMTHNSKLLSKQIEGALFTNTSPQEVVSIAIEKGFQQLMLIGGMRLNSSFLKEKLIDEVWVDVHPLLIGEGKTLFEKSNFFEKLDFIDSKDLGEGQILLRYKIRKG